MTTNSADSKSIPGGANEYASVDGVAQVHDANGNLVSDGRFAYAYNFRNQLVSVRPAAGGDPIASYTYDVFNRRVAAWTQPPVITPGPAPAPVQQKFWYPAPPAGGCGCASADTTPAAISQGENGMDVAAVTHTPGPQGPVPTGGGGSPPAAITAPPTGGSGATPLDWNVKVHTNPAFAGNPFLTPPPAPGQSAAPIATFVTKDALGSSVLYSHAATGLPAAYVDYTPYGAPLPLTILASNVVTGVSAIPAETPNPANGWTYPYPTLNLDLADALPAHLDALTLFGQGLYLWDQAAGQRRLFEIVDRPHAQQLIVPAAPGAIAPDDVFVLVRGDSDRFGLKDTVAQVFAPVLVNGAPATPIRLADSRDRTLDPVRGGIDRGVIGARLRPNSRTNDTYEIIGYTGDPAGVTLLVRGDLTGLIDAPAPGLAADPVFIYAKALPLSPIAFAGYYHDSETGLNYAWNRFQSPTTGRWLTRDPAGYDDGPNMYSYVQNQPLTIVDSRGLNGPDRPYFPEGGGACPPANCQYPINQANIERCCEGKWWTITLNFIHISTLYQGEPELIRSNAEDHVRMSNEVWNQCCIRYKIGTTVDRTSEYYRRFKMGLFQTFEIKDAFTPEDAQSIIEENQSHKEDEVNVIMAPLPSREHVNPTTDKEGKQYLGLAIPGAGGAVVADPVTTYLKNTVAHELGHAIGSLPDDRIRASRVMHSYQRGGNEVSDSDCLRMRRGDTLGGRTSFQTPINTPGDDPRPGGRLVDPAWAR